MMQKRKLAQVDRSSCVSCGTCQNICPRKAITIVHGLYAEVDPTRCVGCGMCSRECPAEVTHMGVRA